MAVDGAERLHPDFQPETNIRFVSEREPLEDMLRISGRDFYVRGVKVKQGPGEAEMVYEAFTAWMQSHNMYGRNTFAHHYWLSACEGCGFSPSTPYCPQCGQPRNAQADERPTKGR